MSTSIKYLCSDRFVQSLPTGKWGGGNTSALAKFTWGQEIHLGSGSGGRGNVLKK